MYAHACTFISAALVAPAAPAALQLGTRGARSTRSTRGTMAGGGKGGGGKSGKTKGSPSVAKRGRANAFATEGEWEAQGHTKGCEIKGAAPKAAILRILVD